MHQSKKYMKKEIKDLILCFDSEDPNEKGNAITNLALLLEMNSYILRGNNASEISKQYKCLLDDDLLCISLDRQEEAEIVDELIKKIKDKDELSSLMLWAIGKTLPEAGLFKLVEIIQSCEHHFDEEESYQAIIALENFMCSDFKKTLSKKKEIIRFLEDKANTSDERLSECSQRSLNNLLRI